jgi:curli biogenesis system outer membrane secretion channel CsgG
MSDKRFPAFAAAVAIIAAISSDAWAQRATMAIGEVKINPAIVEAAASPTQTNPVQANSLRRVAQSMDSVLIDRFNATRKFEIIARSDLDAIFKDQAFQQSGNVDLSDPRTAQQFKVKGTQYLVVPTITDFQDLKEFAAFEGLEERALRRTLRYTVSVRLWDVEKGSLLEAANVTLNKRMTREIKEYIKVESGEFTDALIQEIADELGARVTYRVVDVLFPARIIARTDKQVTINRGDGTGMFPGQMWDVYALGEAMIDPDTGESLGSEEVKVGRIRITDVLPLFTRAEVVEDLGVDRGHVARLREQPQP